MARELLLLWAGRHRREPWERLYADYRTRVERYVSITERQIKARGEGAVRRRAEGKSVLAALPDPCWTIALDPRGKTMSSEALASELRRLEEEWPHPVAFVIGSDLGLDPEIVRRARRRLSFGPMTFGHELARLMLYEQIYRTLSIQRGIKYHRPAF
ncbi:MAG: 23S rRNA (pseudouridine(1915)-N(3))-methyltransferase RlmH [bacterium]|nr:23S rRNA (pseudouridine(1915)-N(3))-methyltransferase RlmH [bacterium]